MTLEPHTEECVVVAEDEPGLREHLASMIRDLGVLCLEAGDGAEALALCRANPVFLVLTDLSMPKMSGLQLAQALRDDGQRVPIALFSGHIEQMQVKDGVKAGFDEVFEKPSDFGRLRAYVKAKVARRREELAAEEAEMRSLRAIFCEEAVELFRDVEGVIFRLEESPGDAALVALLFRKAHTLKGSAGSFKGTERITKLTHAYEQLLVALKDRRLEVTSELTDVLLRGADVIRSLVDEYSGGAACEVDVGPLAAEILAIATGKASVSEARAPAQAAAGPSTGAHGAPARERNAKGTARAVAPAGGATTAHAAEEDEGILVSNEKLSRFMELSGELVVFKNSYNVVMRQIMALEATAAFRQQVEDLTHSLNKISEQIQTQIMDVRKVVLKNAFSKFNRAVRQVAQDLRKQIRLEMIGVELGVDRTIAKSLAACLIHILRNGADHGIESPEERARCGKPETGTITLACSQVGDSVFVRVSDDGQGIRADKVLAKAVERGLVTQEQAASLTPRDVYELLFLPGFSTAEKVTNVSGRGVGMDVVRSEITKLGGTVELESEPGKGTTYHIRVPVPKTVLVENAILARSQEHLLAIPLTSIAKIAARSELLLNNIQGRTTCQHDGCTVPVARLHDYVAGAEDEARDRTREASLDSPDALVVILTHKGQSLGVVVDQVIDQLEAVVRPFDSVVEEMPGFKGTSLLNDEKVAYVVSAEDLVQLGLERAA